MKKDKTTLAKLENFIESWKAMSFTCTVDESTLSMELLKQVPFCPNFKFM